MLPMLASYPNQEHAKRLINGFKFGFSLHFEGARVPLTSKKLKSAFDHREVLQRKLRKEIELGRIVGPFTSPPFKKFRCSPIGLVPKKSPGEFRLIQHLSAPRGSSVNDSIPEKQCTVTYSSFDSAVEIVARLGRGALMGKTDIKSAFRLLPVSPEDFELLGICVDGLYYYDRCLPMGCAVSCSTFECFSTFLEFCTRQAAESRNIVHYLDDFFFAGKADDNECRHAMASFAAICERFGVPVAHEKTEGPVTAITYLGLEIDAVSRQIRVPNEKIADLIEKRTEALNQEKISLRA